MGELLKIENLSFGYDKKPVLKNISLDVKEGEMISVIGENGSGKSTLVKAVNGLLGGYKGRVLYKDRDISKINHIDRAKEIAVLYQNCSCRFPFTCFEVVSMGLYPHRGQLSGISRKDIEFIKAIMELTDTVKFAGKKINCLSGGQAQRVLLAKALVQTPKLLFLDEAMSGLDISSRIEMTDIICDMCHKKGLTAINVLHDINMAFEKSDKIIAMKNGEVYAFGQPEDLLNIKFFREIFNVEVEIDSYKKYFRIIM